jgi:hypothetical protein
MYNYLIYLNPEFKKTLGELLEELKNYFADKKSSPNDFQIDKEKITLLYNNYTFFINENSEEYISEELLELNESFDGKDFAGADIDIQKFSNSTKRFELYGEDDFDMDYFNESLFIIDFFEKDSNYLILETN